MKQSFPKRQQDFARLVMEHLEKQDPEQRLNLDGPGTSSLAAWFLGPKAENKDLFNKLIRQGIEANCNDRNDYFKDDSPYITQSRMDNEYRQSVEELENQYTKLLDNLKGSVPFFSYRYQAHMNWDLTIPGMLGYFSAMLYNQNNVAAEASPVTSYIEALVGDDLCRMLGFEIPTDEDSSTKTAEAIRPWGHITCDGSVANLEAMWAARNLKYYTLSLVAALKNEDVLAPARGMLVPLPDGRWGQLIDLDTWTLLNLNIDAVLDLTVRMKKEYGIPSGVITGALDPYLIQSLGFDEFNKRYLGDFPQPVVMGSSTKHYSWPKNAAVLGIGKNNFIDINVDMDARMDIKHLRLELDKCLQARQPVLMVVVVLGSTEQSAVDPLAKVIAMREEYRKAGLEFVIHVDAAWGGYFASLLRKPVNWATGIVDDPQLQDTPVLQMSEYVTDQYKALPNAESITIDPHKAGYIPYPAGGLCYRNSCMRNLVAFLAPEVYHGGEIDASMGVFGIEGSKPGASAAGVYLSHRIIRPDQSGYGQILGKALFNSKRFFSAIITMPGPDDPFIVIPVQQIPAEKEGKTRDKIEEQLKFIQERIVKPENNELQKDDQAMELLKQLGSDQIIITYAFNFKNRDHQINTDPVKANEFNHAIFKKLSLSPDSDQVQNTPLIITTSEFDPEVYGEEFVRTFMKRLGVKHDKLITMDFISSTTMCPWLTATKDGNFIPVLIEAFRDTILDVVKEYQDQ
ncbi:MAG: decarboxylase [Deltaproteobacteria bacterium]|nr:decarboxylase [Deltaproteobacteria bacterium]